MLVFGGVTSVINLNLILIDLIGVISPYFQLVLDPRPTLDVRGPGMEEIDKFHTLGRYKDIPKKSSGNQMKVPSFKGIPWA